MSNAPQSAEQEVSQWVDRRGWNYTRKPPEGDSRKLVWLEENGMAWIGLRAFNHATGHWLNNGEPEGAQVLCWQDLPKRPTRFWSHGQLVDGGDRD